jgi:hypothetical protein
MNTIFIIDPENQDLAYSSIELFQFLDSLNFMYVMLDTEKYISTFKNIFKGEYFNSIEDLLKRVPINENTTKLIGLHTTKSKQLKKIVKRFKLKTKIGFNLGFWYSPFSIELKKGKKEHIKEIYAEIISLLGINKRFEKENKEEKPSNKLTVFYDLVANEWPLPNWTFFFRNPSLFRYNTKIVIDENVDSSAFTKMISVFKNSVESSTDINLLKVIEASDVILTFSNKIAIIASFFSKKTILITKNKSIIKAVNPNCFIIHNSEIKSVLFDSFLQTFRKLTDEV